MTTMTHEISTAASYEPGSMEVFITVAVGTLFGSLYKEYVDRMGLKGNERVLDFGSGSGNPARYIAPILLRGGGSLTCTDVSRTWLDMARRRLKKYHNVEYGLGDIAMLDLPAHAYDVVLIHFVLHEISAGDRPRVVGQLADKLKGSGALYIREPLRFISPEEIRALMQQHGLHEAQSRTAEIPTQGTVYEGVFCLS